MLAASPQATVTVPQQTERENSCPFQPVSGKPTSKKELFNLRLCQLRYLVEAGIGILKQRFKLLMIGIPLEPSQSNAAVYACILLHNFAIAENVADPDEDDCGEEYLEELLRKFNIQDRPQVRSGAAGPSEGVSDDISSTEGRSSRQSAANEWRDEIAEVLWTQYQAYQNSSLDARDIEEGVRLARLRAEQDRSAAGYYYVTAGQKRKSSHKE
eukprot:m.247458 g.247458  ORF g.247458 m.247458 type:complete len:213 (-) comp22599_c0_seq3:52-690(-)